MNDASGDRLDEHLEESSHKIETGIEKRPPHSDGVEHDEPHLDPTRWWYASSAFPMIAGTLGPVASAFSICALVKPWRQFYPPDSNIDLAGYIDDPYWLTIINAVQLAIAIVSNMALLLNMTRRLRFSIAQPVTIVGWYISSLALIALTATAAGPLVVQPAEEYIWSQAFYYGVYSAILYFIVASLMVVTFMGAWAGRYPKDFLLTPSQRTLMLQTILFLIYLLVGALVFSHIEHWNYYDAVYWAAVTLFTVGFGDFYASTTLGRALLIPYALIGIISLGLVIGSIRSLVLERGKRRFDARMIERKRRQMLRRIARRGEDGILVPIQDQQGSVTPRPSTANSGLTEFERREEEFKLMRRIQDAAAHRRRWYSMAISTGTWLVLWLVGAKIFQECELPYQGWSYFEAFYFAFVSLTTIGYGDVTPISNGGKSFWVFWALLALPTMTVMISNAGDTIVKLVRDSTDKVATITILPGERGFKADFKAFLRMLSFGRLFEEDIREVPPGFLGESQRVDYSSAEDEEEVANELEQDENALMAEGAAPEAFERKKATEEEGEGTHAKRVEANTELQSGANAELQSGAKSTGKQITFSDDASLPPVGRRKGSIAGTLHSIGSSSSIHRHGRSHADPSSSSQLLKFTRTASMPRQALPDIPTSKADYHVVLAEEIGRVMQHLKSEPPRKYTFQEWAWYLRLIGEDESTADGHRMEQPHEHSKEHKIHRRKSKQAEEDGKKCSDDEEPTSRRASWSWVGPRSPLMGSKEEAEWILEKLAERLTEELRETRKTGKKKSMMPSFGGWGLGE